MIAALSILQTVAAVYVLWHALCAINAMTHRTHHGIRLGVLLIAIGAFFEAAQILWAHEPDIPEILILLGVAIGTHYNKRAARCPCVVIDRSERCPVREG
jgi:hypothetical protein